MNITEKLANYTITDLLPNSKSFVINTENIILIGQVVTLGYYNELANPFSSFIEKAINNGTDQDYENDSNSNNTDIYEIAIA